MEEIISHDDVSEMFLTMMRHHVGRLETGSLFFKCQLFNQDLFNPDFLSAPDHSRLSDRVLHMLRSGPVSKVRLRQNVPVHNYHAILKIGKVHAKHRQQIYYFSVYDLCKNY